MPTSITILDKNDDYITTVFFTNAVYRHLEENHGFLVKGQSLDKFVIQKKYDDLNRVDEKALEFQNLLSLEKQDPTFFTAYQEVKNLYDKDPVMFNKKLLLTGISKHCLKISHGDESANILKLPKDEQLHAFILDDLYAIWAKEKATIRDAKEFFNKYSEPYTIYKIFDY